MTQFSQSAKGFTLIELMIVVAVIAILSAIAYPSYVNYVLDSRRATATACLVEHGQYMERYYTTNLDYEIDPAAMPAFGCETELAEFYAIDFVADPTATAYTVQAVPQGSQQRDTECGTLTLNQIGGRTANGSAAPAIVAECW